MIALAAALHLLAGQVMVLDEGNRLGRKLNLNFAGAGVVCVSNGASQATCTISGGGAGGAPTTATYWTGSADATLSAEYNLGALATGLVLNTAGAPSAYGGTDAAPANQWLRSLSASGVGTWAQPAFSDVSGTLAYGQLAVPLSGVGACGANTWASTLNGNGAPTCTQPGFSNLSGSATAAQLPDATGAAKGAIVLAGDLFGTAASPSVSDDSHAHTTTTISGLDTGDITTGTLAGARGGVGVALPTCAGTDKLTANGTQVSCAVDQTGGAGGGISPLTVAAFGGF